LIAYAKQDKIKAIFFIPWFFLLNFLCLQCIGYIEVDAGIFSYRFLFLKPMADNELTKMLACSSTCTFETLTLTVDQQSSRNVRSIRCSTPLLLAIFAVTKYAWKRGM
jgi:hypothetical protein